jgi:DivIVA domain-containing protein
VVGDQDSQENQGHEEAARSRKPTDDVGIGQLRGEVPAELRDVSFPTAVRGYDRRAVDVYVKRVNRVIAELEVGRSPQAAVRHALDRVGQQTSGVLQRAREVAEELAATALAEAEQTTGRARDEADGIVEDARMQAHKLRAQSKEEADGILAQARAEAAERLQRSEKQLKTFQDQAEIRLRELQVETDAASHAHRRVLEDLRGTAAELEKIASAASDRLEPTQAGERPQQARAGKATPQRTATSEAKAGDARELADLAPSQHNAKARSSPPGPSALSDLSDGSNV